MSMTVTGPVGADGLRRMLQKYQEVSVRDESTDALGVADMGPRSPDRLGIASPEEGALMRVTTGRYVNLWA